MRHEGRRSAPRGGRPSLRRRGPRSGSWLLRTTLSRTRAQWRLLLGVIAVAVLANVLVTSLSLLVSATEQGGVRGALTELPAQQTELEVRLIDPTIDLADGRAIMTKAVDSVFAPAATTTSTGMALSGFVPVSQENGAVLDGPIPTLTYFGEFDGIADAARLVDGTWPRPAQAEGPQVAVAIPVTAARALSLGVGATLVAEAGETDVTATVTGVYEPLHPDDDFWAYDRLGAVGYNPAFPDPSTSFYKQTIALGALVVGDGALAAADIPVAFADLLYTPDFSRTTVEQVKPLLDRLETADVDIPYRSNGMAGAIFPETDAAAAVSAVAAGLIVTRSTVVVVSLLLVVLAVAAMSQLARLFSDARAGERQLMRARGASRRNILALAVVEAVAVGIVTAAATPPLASLVYRLLAAQGPMMAARMPSDAGIPPASWLVAAAIAAVFAVVLLAPLARPELTFVEATQAAGRQSTASGLARSGIDVVLVVLAGVAYWQLQAYRTPVQESASLAVDPVLVAGPAIVLVATALVCVRLIPAASRLLERAGSGARGSTVALASWEIGRRSQRATAAVLLLSLTLAVGTFGLSFLTTWKQSQLDQASFAVGAPVRVLAEGDVANALAPSPDGSPAEPTIRRPMLIGGLSADPAFGDGGFTSVLALTEAGRDQIVEGRLGALGGDAIAEGLSGSASQATTIDLPADASGFAATVRLGDPAAPLVAVAAELTAVVETGGGQLSLLPLGRIDGDGLDHAVSADFAADLPRDGLRFAGLQAKLIDTSEDGVLAERGEEPADLLVADLAGLTSGGQSVALAPSADDEWFGSSSVRSSSLPSTDDVPAGWQLRLGVSVPADLQSSSVSYSLVGWQPYGAIPAVVSGALADRLGAALGADFDVRTGGASTSIHVVGVAPLVPGAARTQDLAGPAPALGGTAAALAVVDQTRLARSLVEAGVTGPLVDEWWVDVSPGDSAGYLSALPDAAVAVSASRLAERLQESPLRVATQAALWVAIAASTLLAAVGFGVHSAAGLRSRRLELAQLRAIGYSRRRLVGLIATESLLMSVLGAVFGISIGVLLAFLVGPLVAVSPTGAPTVPSVVVDVPVAGIALLLAEVVVVLAIVVSLVARGQRFTEPASLLREGAQP